MHICLVEDTHLHGGTQIWVSEAVRDFLRKGHDVTLLTAAGGFNAVDGAETDARVAVALEAVNALRQSAAVLAQQAAAAAELAASDQHPIVRELAEGNAALTQELPEIALRTQAVTAQLERIAELGQLEGPDAGTRAGSVWQALRRRLRRSRPSGSPAPGAESSGGGRPRAEDAAGPVGPSKERPSPTGAPKQPPYGGPPNTTPWGMAGPVVP